MCVFVRATPLKQQAHFTIFFSSLLLSSSSFFLLPDLLLTSSSFCLLIVHSLSLSPSASLSEYGPHRLPISLVCRRLQRLLRLADPPGQGQRAAASPSSSSSFSSSSAALERQSQRAATSAAAETQPHTGYPPL